MVLRTLRPSLVAVCLAALLVTSGCVSTGPVEDETVHSYVQQFEQQMNDLDGFTATRTTTVTLDGENTTSTAEVWARPGTGEMRTRTLSPESNEGDLVVRSANTSWSYDASENSAYRIDLSDSAVATSNGVGWMLDDLANRSNVSYSGTEQLGGRTVHRIEFAPNTAAAYDGNMTVWVDAATRFPVKLHQRIDTEALNATITIRYDDVELNPGIDDDRFTFDPPANATVEETSLPPSERYESLDALRSNASMAVPTPDLPDGFQFEQAVVTHLDDGDTLSMSFTNGSARLSIGKQEVGAYGNLSASGDGETVTVGDTTATYNEYAGTGILQWEDDDHRYSVGGTLSKEQLVTVAASVADE